MPASKKGSVTSRGMDSLTGTTSEESSTFGSSATSAFGGSRVKTLEESLFSVLYTLTQHGKSGKLIPYIAFSIDFVQMLGFVLAQDFPWGTQMKSAMSGLVSVFQLRVARLVANNYETFLAIFWVVIAIIVFAIWDVVWVSSMFKKNEFKYMWPIKFLRMFVSLLVSVLFLPFFNILLFTLDCHYYTNPPGLDEFPDIACWQPINAVHSAISLLSAISFSLFSLTVALVYIDPDPTKNEPLTTPHSFFDVTLLVSRVILATCTTFISGHLAYLAVVNFFVHATCFVAIVALCPYFSIRVTRLRSGFFAVLTFASFILLGVVRLDDPSDDTLSYVLLAGAFPSFALGFWLPVFRLRYLDGRKYVHVIRQQMSANGNSGPFVTRNSSTSATGTYRFFAGGNSSATSVKPRSSVTSAGGGSVEDADGLRRSASSNRPSSTELAPPVKLPKSHIYNFKKDLEVELATRFLQEDDSTEAREIARSVYEYGLTLFPSSCLLLLTYASFAQFYLKDLKLAQALVEKANELNPFFGFRFLVYRKRKEAFSKGGADDVISAVDFRKNYKAARKFHLVCVKAMNQLWRTLLPNKVNIVQVPGILERIYKAEERAELHFRHLLKKYKNPRTLRAYGAFVADCKNNHMLAQRYFAVAEDMEDDEQNEDNDRTRKMVPSSAFGAKSSAPGVGGASATATLAQSLRASTKTADQDPTPKPTRAHSFHGSQAATVVRGSLSSQLGMMTFANEVGSPANEESQIELELANAFGGGSKEWMWMFDSSSNLYATRAVVALDAQGNTVSINEPAYNILGAAMSTLTVMTPHGDGGAERSDPIGCKFSSLYFTSHSQAVLDMAIASDMSQSSEEDSPTSSFLPDGLVSEGYLLVRCGSDPEDVFPIAFGLYRRTNNVNNSQTFEYAVCFDYAELGHMCGWACVDRNSWAFAQCDEIFASMLDSTAVALYGTTASYILEQFAFNENLPDGKSSTVIVDGSFVCSLLPDQAPYLVSVSSAPPPQSPSSRPQSMTNQTLIYMVAKPLSSSLFEFLSGQALGQLKMAGDGMMMGGDAGPSLHSGLRRQGSAGSHVSILDPNAGKQARKRKSDGDYSNVLTASSGAWSASMGSSASTAARDVDLEDMDAMRKKSTVYILHRNIAIALVLMAAFAIAAWATVEVLTGETKSTVDSVKTAGTLAISTQRISTYARSIQIDYLNGNFSNIPATQNFVLQLGNEFRDNLYRIYYLGDQKKYKPIDEELYTSKVPIQQMDSDGTVAQANMPSWVAARLFAYHARVIGRLTIDQIGSPLSNDSFFFLIDNGPKAMKDSMAELMHDYRDYSFVIMEQIRVIEGAVQSASIVVLLALVFVVRFSLQLVHKDKVRSIHLFLMIPKATIAVLLNKQYYIIQEQEALEAADDQPLATVAGDNTPPVTLQSPSATQPTSQLPPPRPVPAPQPAAVPNFIQPIQMANAAPSPAFYWGSNDEDGDGGAAAAGEKSILGTAINNRIRNIRFEGTSATPSTTEEATSDAGSVPPSTPGSLVPQQRPKQTQGTPDSVQIRLSPIPPKGTPYPRGKSHKPKPRTKSTHEEPTPSPPPLDLNIMTKLSQRIEHLWGNSDAESDSEATGRSDVASGASEDSDQAPPVTPTAARAPRQQRTIKPAKRAVELIRNRSGSLESFGESGMSSGWSDNGRDAQSSPVQGPKGHRQAPPPSSSSSSKKPKEEAASVRTKKSKKPLDTKSNIKKALADRKLERAIASPAVKKMTVKYMLVVVAIGSFLIASFVVGFQTIDKVITSCEELDLSSTRSYLTSYLRILARELMITKTETLRAMVRETSDQLLKIHAALLYGDSSMGITGSALRYAPQEDLLYQQGCSLLDTTQCPSVNDPYYEQLTAGLATLLRDYLENCLRLAHLPLAEMHEDNIYYQFVWDKAFWSVREGLIRSTDLYEQESFGLLNSSAMIQLYLMLSILSLLVFLYLIVFRPMIRFIREETKRTCSMLLMLPRELVESVEEIRKFVEEKQIEQQQENAEHAF